MYVPFTGALFVALALLAGCATPRYQTSSRLEAPTDPTAASCLERCEVARNACQTHCQAQRETCLKTIDAEVERQYAEALKRYAAALELYRMDLERYRMDVWLTWGRGHFWYDPWPFYATPAMAPSPPGKDKIRDRVAKERCDSDCGCGDAYEACFIGCGGRKVEETRCIANCPSP